MQLTSTDPSTGLELRFGFEPVRLVSGRPVRWLFTVLNRGRERRAVAFTSGQRGDVLLSADGVQRYRWSGGRMFAAVLCERELSPGEEWRFSLEDTLALPAGRYVLDARMTARPTIPSVRGDVMIQPAQ